MGGNARATSCPSALVLRRTASQMNCTMNVSSPEQFCAPWFSVLPMGTSTMSFFLRFSMRCARGVFWMYVPATPNSQGEPMP